MLCGGYAGRKTHFFLVGFIKPYAHTAASTQQPAPAIAA